MDHSVRKLTPYRVISIALLIILALMMLFPLYWIVTGSVKDARTINSRTPVLFPTNPTLDNYTKLFSPPRVERGCSTPCSSAAWRCC